MEARDAAFASMFALCCGHESMRRNRNAEAAAVRIDTSRLNLTPRGHEEKTPSRLPFSARHSLTEQASHKPDVDAWSPLKSDQSRFDFDAPARMPCGDTVPDFDVGDSNDVSEVPPADATQGDASYRAPLLADDTDGYTGSAAPLEKLNSWKQEAQERSRTERRHSTDQAIAKALEHIHKTNGEDMKPLLNGNAAQEVAVTAALGHLYQNASVNGKLAVVAAVAADAADARVPCVSSDLKMETKLAASAALKLAYSAASPRSSVGQMKTKLAVSAALKHAYSSASSPREALKNGRQTPRQVSVSAALRHVYRYSSEHDKQRATDGKSAVSRALRYLYRYASDKAEAVQTRAGVVLAQGEPDGRLDRALQQIASARSQAQTKITVEEVLAALKRATEKVAALEEDAKRKFRGEAATRIQRRSRKWLADITNVADGRSAEISRAARLVRRRAEVWSFIFDDVGRGSEYLDVLSFTAGLKKIFPRYSASQAQAVWKGCADGTGLPGIDLATFCAILEGGQVGDEAVAEFAEMGAWEFLELNSTNTEEDLLSMCLATCSLGTSSTDMASYALESTCSESTSWRESRPDLSAVFDEARGTRQTLDMNGFDRAIRRTHAHLSKAQVDAISRGYLKCTGRFMWTLDDFCTVVEAVEIGDHAVAEFADLDIDTFISLGVKDKSALHNLLETADTAACTKFQFSRQSTPQTQAIAVAG